MAKRYKPPVNYRTAPVNVNDEPIEVETTPDGTYAVLAEAPHYDLLTYPMTVTVGGVPRARVAGSPAAGQYRILSTTVYGSDGQPHVEYLPVLEFHSSDNGLAGAVSYYRTGTVVTSQYLKMLREFLQPISGYASLGTLGAAYPPQSDPDIRGHESDWAILTDGTMAAVINGSWAILAGGGTGAGSPIVPVAAWLRASGVDPTVIVSGALSITPGAAYMLIASADPSVDTASGTNVSPAARFHMLYSVAPTVVLDMLAPTGHSVVAGNTLVTMHPGTMNGATSFNAYWTSDGTDPSKTNGTKITGVTDGQQHTGLNNGTLYKYVFTAQNDWGEGPESTVVSATPAAGGVAVSDNFNRADGGLGANWTTLGNCDAPRVSSNTVIVGSPTSNSRSVARWSADMFANNQYAEVAILTPGVCFNIGPAVRISASAVDMYAFRFYEEDDGFGGTLHKAGLVKVVAGTVTALGTEFSWDYVGFPAIARIEVNGTSITGYTLDTHGGTKTSRCTATDSALSSGSAGLAIWGTLTTPHLDDWYGGDLA